MATKKRKTVKKVGLGHADFEKLHARNENQRHMIVDLKATVSRQRRQLSDSNDRLLDAIQGESLDIQNMLNKVFGPLTKRVVELGEQVLALSAASGPLPAPLPTVTAADPAQLNLIGEPDQPRSVGEQIAHERLLAGKVAPKDYDNGVA